MEIGATGPLMGDLMSVTFGRVERVQLEQSRVEIEIGKDKMPRISFCRYSPSSASSLQPVFIHSHPVPPLPQNLNPMGVRNVFLPFETQSIYKQSTVILKFLTYYLLRWKALTMLCRRTCAGSSGRFSGPRPRSPRAPATPLTTPSSPPSPAPLR